MCGICGVFAVTLTWIVQIYLQLLSCLVVSIIVILFCMVLLTLTSQGFKSVQNQLARLMTKSSSFNRSVPLLRSLYWLPVRFRILFKINLLTYKTLREKQPVYLHSVLAASLPSRSLRSNSNNSPSVPKVKTNTGEVLFNLVPRFFRTTCCCLSVQPFQLLPSRNIWRHISLTSPFPNRYQHG